LSKGTAGITCRAAPAPRIGDDPFESRNTTKEKTMSDSQKNFVWYELVTSDMGAAEAFYRKVVGWDAQAFDGSGEPYKILSMKGKGVGGLMPMPEGMSQPFWMGYVGTSDIDAAVTR
jgi:uncharacterized protein